MHLVTSRTGQVQRVVINGTGQLTGSSDSVALLCVQRVRQDASRWERTQAIQRRATRCLPIGKRGIGRSRRTQVSSTVLAESCLWPICPPTKGTYDRHLCLLIAIEHIYQFVLCLSPPIKPQRSCQGKPQSDQRDACSQQPHANCHHPTHPYLSRRRGHHAAHRY